MPTFYSEEIDVSPDEFLSACDKEEIKEIIDALVEDGYIRKNDVLSSDGKSTLSASEDIFEEHLNALHGRLHMLTNEEEETIIKIASKFRYL